jgi:hypothetical protein
MPPFTIRDAENNYENPEHMKMIITNELYQQIMCDLYGDEEQQGNSGFWTGGPLDRGYLEYKYDLLERYYEHHFSKDFKKQVIHTYGLFEAFKRYYNHYDSCFEDIFETDEGESEFYNRLFKDIIWEHIRYYEEEWREEDREEEDEEDEEEEQVDTDEASDADTDEEN